MLVQPRRSYHFNVTSRRPLIFFVHLACTNDLGQGPSADSDLFMTVPGCNPEPEAQLSPVERARAKQKANTGSPGYVRWWTRAWQRLMRRLAGGAAASAVQAMSLGAVSITRSSNGNAATVILLRVDIEFTSSPDVGDVALK